MSEDKYKALSWFLVGYFDRANMYQSTNEGEALQDALKAYRDYKEGRCLRCKRERIALLDGYFCGQCSPGVSELIE